MNKIETLQIFRNTITYHRNQIRFLCQLAREAAIEKAPLRRVRLLTLARREAYEIKDALRILKLS